MPSSKKARGRARRAAKEAKAVEEEVEETVVANQDGSLEAQMQRLTINNLLRESDAVQCRHGYELEGNEARLCLEFVDEFDRGYDERLHAGEREIRDLITAGVNATMEKFASVLLNDVEKMEHVVSYYVASATQNILDGNDDAAHINASFTSFFEAHVRYFLKSGANPPIGGVGGRRIAELQWADMNTLVTYLRKRIPCDCLDKKYEEVKSITKIGLCANSACPLPERKVERKKMFTCSGCSMTYYCSYECQKAHWPVHKKYCKTNSTLS